MPTGKTGTLGFQPGNIELGFAPSQGFSTIILPLSSVTIASPVVSRALHALWTGVVSVRPTWKVNRTFASSIVGLSSMLDEISTSPTINHSITKNYGPSTSGFLDPTSRNWETVVFEMGKPVLDREVNLVQDIDGGAGQLALTTAMPSGWISDDFTGSSDPAAAIFTPEAHSNFVRIPQNLIAHVNGWVLIIANTNVSDHNLIVLPTPPVGAGTARTDLIVLEVWRKLISPAPSTDGKSAAGRIWQNGNVKTDPINDTSLNPPDDIEGSDVNMETTKRVQIQYRLRAIPGVDLLSFPYGMDDPSIRANSVPPNASTPDGNSTTFVYLTGDESPHPSDQGLWVAGDGDPTNTLNTVDGYMYAIPLMAVARRNSSGFDRVVNQNGGQLLPTASDRPDGLLADLINPRDIIDLRYGVSPVGWNYAEVLDKNITYLFDNNLRTEVTQDTNAGTQFGHSFLWNDQMGISTTNGGSAPNNGSGPGTGGPLIGQFDNVRRRFTDRPMLEVITVAVSAPGGGWANGSFTIDFTNLSVYPYGPINWTAYAPSGIVATDIIGAHFIGASGKKSLNALGHLASVTNLGLHPITVLNVTMDALGGLGITNETLYVDILVTYPSGGLTFTPTTTYGSSGFTVNNPSALSSSSPVLFSALANQGFDAAHRGAQIQYVTTSQTLTFAADTTISSNPTFRLPERASSITAVQRNGVAISGGVTLSSDGRTGTFTLSADYSNPGDTLQVTFVGLRPIPQTGVQISAWYETRAPQAARDATVLGSITVIPRYVSPHLYVITTGSGSEDTGYPFPVAYAQTGGIYPGSSGTFSGEHTLNARGNLSISGFSGTTGFLKLPVLVPYMPDPEAVTFTRAVNADIDIEGRSFFKSAPAGYLPNAFAQDLSDPKIHKVVLPMLAELSSDSLYGHKGQLVLVNLIRWATNDETSGVFFNANLALNTTVASVFRIKGNLLNRRNV